MPIKNNNDFFKNKGGKEDFSKDSFTPEEFNRKDKFNKREGFNKRQDYGKKDDFKRKEGFNKRGNFNNKDSNYTSYREVEIDSNYNEIPKFYPKANDSKEDKWKRSHEEKREFSQKETTAEEAKIKDIEKELNEKPLSSETSENKVKLTSKPYKNKPFYPNNATPQMQYLEPQPYLFYPNNMMYGMQPGAVLQNPGMQPGMQAGMQPGTIIQNPGMQPIYYPEQMQPVYYSGEAYPQVNYINNQYTTVQPQDAGKFYVPKQQGTQPFIPGSKTYTPSYQDQGPSPYRK